MYGGHTRDNSRYDLYSQNQADKVIFLDNVLRNGGKITVHRISDQCLREILQIIKA